MKRLGPIVVAAALLAGSCSSGGDQTVRLLAHDFFAVPEPVLAEFTAETGFRVEVIRGGDAGLMVNQAILTAGNPVADVLFGVDTTLLSRSVEARLFSPYRSGSLDRVPREFWVDGDPVTPVDFGDVCLNYDKLLLPDPPVSLRDLAEPKYAGLLVVPDPTVSSPGLAFLLATVAEFGETGYSWRDYWRDLRANDVQIAADWGSAYYGSFSATGGGDRPIVLSYASSPPAEVMFADPPINEAVTAVIEAGCFRQIEYAGVLRGARNAAGARALIDFMLSRSFQESVPTSMFVFPVRSDAELPAVFTDNTVIPAAPAVMDPALIEANRDRWLAEWTETVLR